MKRKLSLVLALVLILLSLCACGKTADSDSEAFIYYVNLSSDGSGDGSEASPFSSITEARDAIRKLKEENGLPDGGVTVLVSGKGKISESVVFTEADSGEADRPISYRATDEEAVLDGGVTLNPSSFIPAAEAPGNICSRLPKEAQNKVVALDLTAAGCYDLDDTKIYGTGWSSSHFRQKLTVNGKFATVARYPNLSDGYEKIVSVGSSDDTPGKTQISAEKAELWKSASEMRMFAYPEYDWNGKHYRVESVDFENSLLIFDSDEGYGVKDGGTYFVYNLPEELDEAGEYYWDTESNYLFYYPEEDFENSEISFTELYGHMIVIDGAENIGFDGIIFENYRGCGISVEDRTEGLEILNCTFRCGQYGVSVTGNNIVIDGCEFCELGGRCSEIDCEVAGDVSDLEYANVTVTDCSFHDYAQDYRVYNPAISLYGCGALVAHNEIYSAPHSAIISVARDAIIEYNRIHDVCFEVDDCGAVYIGDRWDVKGTEIRYNYIYNINDTVNGKSPNGIHLDDETSDVVCTGNVLANIGGDAFRIGGGRNLRVTDNILVGVGGFSVHIDDRGIDWHSTGYDANSDSFGKATDEHDWRSDLWRYRFAGLQILSETPEPSGNYRDEPGVPSGNLVRGNVAFDCGGAADTPENEGVYGNMYYTDGMEICALTIKYGTVADNILYSENPGFTGFGDEFYEISADSRICRDLLGFDLPDCEKIGIRK